MFNSFDIILVIFKDWLLFESYENYVNEMNHFLYLNKCQLRIEIYLILITGCPGRVASSEDAIVSANFNEIVKRRVRGQNEKKIAILRRDRFIH